MSELGDETVVAHSASGAPGGREVPRVLIAQARRHARADQQRGAEQQVVDPQRPIAEVSELRKTTDGFQHGQGDAENQRQTATELKHGRSIPWKTASQDTPAHARRRGGIVRIRCAREALATNPSRQPDSARDHSTMPTWRSPN